MSRPWSAPEEAIVRQAAAWAPGAPCLFGIRYALHGAGFKRTVPEIRDRLLDLELLPVAAAGYPAPTNANAPGGSDRGR